MTPEVARARLQNDIRAWGGFVRMAKIPQT
jgi:hypothetical protein